MVERGRVSSAGGALGHPAGRIQLRSECPTSGGEIATTGSRKAVHLRCSIDLGDGNRAGKGARAWLWKSALSASGFQEFTYLMPESWQISLDDTPHDLIGDCSVGMDQPIPKSDNTACIRYLGGY